MPAASALRAEKAIAERSRGAHPCVAQLASSSSRYGTAPAILAESCNRLQAYLGRWAGWDGLARRQGPLEVAVRRAPRGVRVLARNPGISGRLTRLDGQQRCVVLTYLLACLNERTNG